MAPAERTEGTRVEPRFGESALDVLRFAREEATRLRHHYIGTEHLLLGFARLSDTDRVKALLSQREITLHRVREAVEHTVGRGDWSVKPNEEFSLTPGARRAIKLAIEEAADLPIDSGHLLLGLTRRGRGIGLGVLEMLGVNVERLRAEVTQSYSS